MTGLYVTRIVLIQLGPMYAHVILGTSWNLITGLVKVLICFMVLYTSTLYANQIVTIQTIMNV